MPTIKSYLTMAARVAETKADARTFVIGAVAVRNDGVIVSAYNGPVVYPTADAHAEYRLMRKTGFCSVVYVARVTKGRKHWALAKPCATCQAILKSHRVKKVYFTVEPGQWDILSFED